MVAEEQLSCLSVLLRTIPIAFSLASLYNLIEVCL